jgi:hypothetical protein
MCALCSDEEDGITVMDYTLPEIEDVEEEFILFYDRRRRRK